MGLNTELKKLFCSSCPQHCSVRPEVSPQTAYCTSPCFCLWPEDNLYFNRGIIEGLLTDNNHAMLNGYIFIDFSITNLHIFTDDAWITFLSKSGLRIILISDRHLQPLANFLFKLHRPISAIIYHDDELSVTSDKIRKIFVGYIDLHTRGPTMTQTEFIILGKFINGMTARQIAETMDLNIRHVYACKQRIEKHLGNKLNRLYINARTIS
ncbi:hypothetical protein EBL_c00870 [Shimwellia blattae DSM 4481 = NBRC 105725]|uniref:HTH luxR-type domain-containing protein n=2 Tax=Shimwellia blattae TaxID=563 RepID=I2B3W9_SHIBC|nr:hypothetical protein EBL_c00870 [Shimwellia blattae DSM 4481 = NBRC 105725]GAB80663.1 hypothetical protein YqeH [Shimwellia blattae DSM 4481 = NBRC 105725]VDY62700.1 Uncharacterised protein [Shimwellia blattae]VEC19466.1 Uncharacterised protein [Shimwellia blattae]